MCGDELQKHPSQPSCDTALQTTAPPRKQTHLSNNHVKVTNTQLYNMRACSLMLTARHSNKPLRTAALLISSLEYKSTRLYPSYRCCCKHTQNNSQPTTPFPSAQLLFGNCTSASSSAVPGSSPSFA
jgi:hypothetical protein